MALPPALLQECLNAVGAFLEKRRPRPEIREQLDFRANVSGSEVAIAEVRPSFKDETQKVEHPVARAKWINTRKKWQLYWMRADLKWHLYQPKPEADTLAEILTEVHRDPHGCFFWMSALYDTLPGKMANKAPEPTPGTVTPRATDPKSK